MVESGHVSKWKNYAAGLSTVMYNHCSNFRYSSSIVQYLHISNLRFTYPQTRSEKSGFRRKTSKTLSDPQLPNRWLLNEISGLGWTLFLQPDYLESLRIYWCKIWDVGKLVMLHQAGSLRLPDTNREHVLPCSRCKWCKFWDSKSGGSWWHSTSNNSERHNLSLIWSHSRVSALRLAVLILCCVRH